MLMRNNAGREVVFAVHDQHMLDGLVVHWRDLCGRCVEDTVYYAPDYAMALLKTVASTRDVKFVTAWQDSRLIGLLPVEVRKIPVPGVIVAGRAWSTDYTFSCLPLLDRGHAVAAAAALLDGLASLARGEWVIPNINLEGPACSALVEALSMRGSPWSIDRKFARASLSKGLTFETHMKEHVSSKRRRELGRNRRRLEELGIVSVRTETHGAGLAEAVGVFLELEASGWKGERRTALASNTASRAFAELAFGTNDTSRVDLLLLNDKPIAAGVIVFSGTTGFTVKGAYDEAYAGYGAGLLLEQEVIRSFLNENWASRLDAATDGSHVIDYLWPEKVEVAELTFSLASSAARQRLRGVILAGKAVDFAKVRLKKLLKR